MLDTLAISAFRVVEWRVIVISTKSTQSSIGLPENSVWLIATQQILGLSQNFFLGMLTDFPPDLPQIFLTGLYWQLFERRAHGVVPAV